MQYDFNYVGILVFLFDLLCSSAYLYIGTACIKVNYNLRNIINQMNEPRIIQMLLKFQSCSCFQTVKVGYI